MLVEDSIRLPNNNSYSVKVLDDLICEEFDFIQYDRPITTNDFFLVELIKDNTSLSIVWERKNGVTISVLDNEIEGLMPSIWSFLDKELSKHEYRKYIST